MTRGTSLALLLGGLAVAAAADPVKPDPAAGTPQDVVYFAKTGPVRVRFRVSIDGKPAEAAWQAAVDKLFAFCDRDGNGSLDAKERAVFARPAGGRQPMPVEVDEDGNPIAAAGPQVFGEKDAPADKATFATKLRAAGLKPVGVFVQPGRTDAQQLTDALYRHLDKDNDGKLTADELKAAPERFAALDLDEDELVTGAELRGTVIADAGRNRFQPRFPRPQQEEDGPANADIVELPNGSAAAVKAVVSTRDNDKNGSLNRTEFGGGEKAFAALDKDGNGQLDSDELAAWLRQPPDLEFVLNFDGTPAAGLKVDADGSATKVLADARLRVYADGGGAKSLADGWKQSADRLRSEFGKLAKDKKAVERKQVEGREGRVLLPVFDLADRNADKSLTKEELDAAVEAIGAAAACRVDVMITDQGRGLFELIDRSGDGQFSPREIKEAAGLVKVLDRTGDGKLDKGEIPRLLPVVVAPAGISVVNLAQPQIAPPRRVMGDGQPQPAGPSGGPAWFRKMDRNGDGDVSAREFLGPAELFRKLDADGDGLLSAAEAAAAK